VQRSTTSPQFQKARDTSIIVTVIPPGRSEGAPKHRCAEHVDSEPIPDRQRKGFVSHGISSQSSSGLLEMQARRLGSDEKAQPVLFCEAHPTWGKVLKRLAPTEGNGGDSVFQELLAERTEGFFPAVFWTA